MSEENQETDQESTSETNTAYQSIKDLETSEAVSQKIEGEIQGYREGAARNQHFLVILNQLAVETQLARTTAELYRIISDQVSQLGYFVSILNLDKDEYTLGMTYSSEHADKLETINQLTGLSIDTYRIPIRPDSYFHRVIADRAPVFCEWLGNIIAETLPAPLQSLSGSIIGILHLQHGILAPLTVAGVIKGIFLLSGSDLTPADIPFVSAFANQSAIALDKTRLVEQADQWTLDLEKSESNLKSFFDSAPFMMGIVELKENDILHLSGNLASARFYGTTPEAMQHKLASALGIHQDEIKLWLKNYYQSGSSGEPIHFEYYHAVQEKPCWLAVTVSPIQTTTPGQRYCYVAQDITERKRIEEALQLSEQRMSLHIQQTPLAVIEWDLDFKVTKWNRAAEKIFGFTVEEAIDHHAADLIIPEIAKPHVNQIWNNLLARKGGQRSTNVNITKDGRQILCEWYNTPLISTGEKVIGVASLVQDITEREEAETLREAIFKISQSAVSTETLAELYRSIHKILGELMPVDNFYIALFDPAHDLLSFPYYVDQFDSPPLRQKMGRGLTEYVLRTARPLMASQEVFKQLIQLGEVELEGADSLTWLGVPLKVQDRLIGVMVTQNYTENTHYAQRDLDILEFVSTQVAQVIARKADEEKIRQNVIRTQGLVEISAVIVENGFDSTAVLENIARLVSQLVGDSCIIHLSTDDGLWLQPAAFYHPEPCNPACIQDMLSSSALPIGEGLVGRVAATAEPAVAADIAQADILKTIQPEFGTYLQRYEVHTVLVVPIRTQARVIGTVSVIRDTPGRPYTEDDKALLQDIADRAALAIINARLFSEEQVRSKELAALYSLSSALRQAMLVSDMLSIVLNQVRQLFKADTGMIALINADKTHCTIAQADGLMASNSGRVFTVDEGISGFVLRKDQPYVTHNFSAEPQQFIDLLHEGELGPAIFVPLQSEAELQGFLMIARYTLTRGGHFTDKDVRLLTAIGEMVGNSVRRAQLFEDSQRRLQQTQSLRAIDIAISNSHDLQSTLDIFLDQVIAQLKVDAVSVLLLNPKTQLLNYAAGRGFQTPALKYSHLRLGEGYAGIAAYERRIISIPDLRSRHTDFLRSPTFKAEGFVTYYAIPLATEAQVTGVLEIFQRSPLYPDPEWLEFAQTLAGQAAIAIDNASLFIDLEQSNLELTKAYEATIEGWSRALDLRDHETEGHTQRVAEMTVKLAQAFGLNTNTTAYISRGALLHDIGKMGIPDDILLKPGPFTMDEWVRMRKHPEYARDMLAAIDYLKPAIDIPYCHHEKWDGTGYPRGLKGEVIPFAARIFSVVDVWDALTSNRPYRSAWSKEKALEYIRTESGKHFDPQVVTTFLHLIHDLEI